MVYYIFASGNQAFNRQWQSPVQLKWCNDRLGYGFLQREDGDDVFVHYTEIENEEPLAEGDEVEFEISDGPKGPMATAITKID